MRTAKKLIALILVLGIVIHSCAALSEAAAAETEITVPVMTKMKKYKIPDNEAMALMKDMKCGWNLGNTLDAYDGYSKHSEGIDMETFWGVAEVFGALVGCGVVALLAVE